MDEYKGISMFKVSKKQHRRLLVSLWVVVVLTIIRNLVLPGLPGNAENAGLLLLLPIVKGKVFMFILGATVVVAQCVILNELRVALRRIAHWGQWACLVFMVALPGLEQMPLSISQQSHGWFLICRLVPFSCFPEHGLWWHVCWLSVSQGA